MSNRIKIDTFKSKVDVKLAFGVLCVGAAREIDFDLDNNKGTIRLVTFDPDPFYVLHPVAPQHMVIPPLDIFIAWTKDPSDPNSRICSAELRDVKLCKGTSSLRLEVGEMFKGDRNTFTFHTHTILPGELDHVNAAGSSTEENDGMIKNPINGEYRWL